MAAMNEKETEKTAEGYNSGELENVLIKIEKLREKLDEADGYAFNIKKNLISVIYGYNEIELLTLIYIGTFLGKENIDVCTYNELYQCKGVPSGLSSYDLSDGIKNLLKYGVLEKYKCEKERSSASLKSVKTASDFLKLTDFGRKEYGRMKNNAVLRTLYADAFWEKHL